jgi:hypothetical protein
MSVGLAAAHAGSQSADAHCRAYNYCRLTQAAAFTQLALQVLHFLLTGWAGALAVAFVIAFVWLVADVVGIGNLATYAS